MIIIIDGRPLPLEGSPTLLEVARANGIFIPSLCDHPGLEPYAACRLCLVEVEGRRGYLPACNTPAEEGMNVRTKTPELETLRRGILELILSEHPNACLACAEKTSCDDFKSTIRKVGEVTGCVLCPANGRCQLQRVVEAIGVDRVHFPSLRREGEVRRDDPFIDRDNSLCILCGRCARVCHEVRGASVLTFIFRGSQTVIGTAQDRRLVDSGCRFCGACVDVCPTGSLAERGVRYKRPPDEEKPALCPFCGQGCKLRVGLKEGRILGAVPDPDGAVNRGQACVKGRFLVKDAVRHPSRLLRPMIRLDGRLQPVSWEEALGAVAERLGRIAPGRVAVAASAQNSCEDLFVLHRFASDVLKAGSITGPWLGSAAAELRELGRAAGRPLPLNFKLSDIGGAETILLIGEDLPVTQPLVGVEVNRAVRNGAVLLSIGVEGGRNSMRSPVDLTIPPGKEDAFLEALAAAVSNTEEPAAAKALHGLRIPERTILKIAGLMKSRKPPLFLFGPVLLGKAGGRNGLVALRNLAARTKGRIIPLDREANLRGGLEIAEAFPAGLVGAGNGIRALYLAGPFPKPEPGAAELVVVQGSYMDENASIADIILPEATSFEAEGAFVYVEGRIQLSEKALDPPGEAKPGWLILSELAEKMGAAGFGRESAADVRKDLAGAVAAFGNLSSPSVSREGTFLVEKIGEAEIVLVGRSVAGTTTGSLPAGFRDPDDYKGLALAREHKSLKLIRGR